VKALAMGVWLMAASLFFCSFYLYKIYTVEALYYLEYECVLERYEPLPEV